MNGSTLEPRMEVMEPLEICNAEDKLHVDVHNLL